MTISLASQSPRVYINQKIEAGMYNSVSEVVREALRKDIGQGLASLDKGEGKPLDVKAIKAKG